MWMSLKVVVASPLEGTAISFVSKSCGQISFHYFFLWVALGQEWEIQEGKNEINAKEYEVDIVSLLYFKICKHNEVLCQ